MLERAVDLDFVKDAEVHSDPPVDVISSWLDLFLTIFSSPLRTPFLMRGGAALHSLLLSEALSSYHSILAKTGQTAACRWPVYWPVYLMWPSIALMQAFLGQDHRSDALLNQCSYIRTKTHSVPIEQRVHQGGVRAAPEEERYERSRYR